MSEKKQVVLRFEDLTFEFIEKMPILKEANFSVRENS